ncbi:MAG: hypothetical protein CMM92_05700 [Rickettsiales bacterium]|nr:hypothetical protein [Rickettsiales bacterium]|tara:strand:+ start:4374 stop:4646 length:273 start_codon:yes stop_codon:yes gene_type:complete
MYYAPLFNHVDGIKIITIIFKYTIKNFYRIFDYLVNNIIMEYREKESIHQEFERFMRDEMDDLEKKKYIKSDNYRTMLNLLTKTLGNLKN